MDATQANAQISEFLQNYMATNNFDENLFLEKEQYISDYFKVSSFDIFNERKNSDLWEYSWEKIS